jgi:thymidylate synthase (FAD)
LIDFFYRRDSLAHLRVEEAEALLDKEFRVLDHGFVRLIDYLGGDDRIVASARVSYGPGTKTVREDRKLIHYLMRRGHLSPFEQVVLTFHVKLPIFVARQWIRHRTARVNEMSGRYSVFTDEFYLPESEQIRVQSTRSKQGRGEELSEEQRREVLDIFRRDQERSFYSYRGLIEANVARELARINLPLSTYTQWYWQIDLRNLFNFLRLRMDPHAQHEIRLYAVVLAKIAKSVAPFAYEAFDEHILRALLLPSATKEKLIEYLDKISATSHEAEELLKLIREDEGPA